jgi:acyl-coenzyme A synthetase/AMP-(fatty) acid ligase/3-hydroxymyristoyl/3-hydroxydecanoyl-(acyl carrier protein) dehydratase
MTLTFDEIAHAPADDRPLCMTSRASLTWADFRGDTDALVARLARRRESRWGLYANSSYDFSVGLFALWRAGKTPVIPSSDSPGSLAALGSHIDARLGDLADAQAIRLAEAGAMHEAPVRPIGAAELILVTSGSSGTPKLVRKRAAQLEAEIETLDVLWGARVAGGVVLATVSHQHIYGLLFKLLWPLASQRVYFADLVREPNLLGSLTSRHERCVWVSSPAQLKRLPDGFLATVDRARVAAVFSSGGLLPTPVADRIAGRLGQPPIEVYGSTETGGVAYRQQWPGEAETMWRPLPRVELATTADEQIEVRSPHLPDDAWYATGDLGRVLPGPLLQLGKRVDRIVKVEEKRVSLSSMEGRLSEISGVIEAACFVQPGRRDFVFAVLALDSSGYRELYSVGRRRYARKMRDALGAHFDRVTIPRKWRFVDALPVNQQGKVSADRLAGLFEHPRVATLPVVQSVDSLNEHEVRLSLHIPKQLGYFKGHFPGSPVLPGVVQLLWVDHFARQLLDIDGGWQVMEAVKFNRLVLPDSTVTLALRSRDDQRQIQFSYSIDGLACSSGRLVRRG